MRNRQMLFESEVDEYLDKMKLSDIQQFMDPKTGCIDYIEVMDQSENVPLMKDLFELENLSTKELFQLSDHFKKCSEKKIWKYLLWKNLPHSSRCTLEEVLCDRIKNRQGDFRYAQICSLFILSNNLFFSNHHSTQSRVWSLVYFAVLSIRLEKLQDARYLALERNWWICSSVYWIISRIQIESRPKSFLKSESILWVLDAEVRYYQKENT